MYELYTSNEFLKYMKEHGLPSSRDWLYYNEELGKLTCPRRPNSRRDRVFTLDQMNEIVEAFSPSGKGEWHYEENNFTSTTNY